MKRPVEAREYRPSPLEQMTEAQKEDLKRRIREFLQIPEVRGIEIQNLGQVLLVAIGEQPAVNIHVSKSENLERILLALKQLGVRTCDFHAFGYVSEESDEPEEYVEVLVATSNLTLNHFMILMDEWHADSWKDPDMATRYGYFMGFPKTAVAAFAKLLPNIHPLHDDPEEPVYPPFGRFRYSDENFTQEFEFLLSRNLRLYHMSPEIFELLVEQQDDEEDKNLIRTFIAYAQSAMVSESKA